MKVKALFLNDSYNIIMIFYAFAPSESYPTMVKAGGKYLSNCTAGKANKQFLFGSSYII
jgi:hypothetical protein